MNNNYVGEKGNKSEDTNQENKLEFFQLACQLLSHLPERSQNIMKKRYGLTGNKAETLEHIGREYKITRERVRQIVSDALADIADHEDDANFQRAEKLILFTIEGNNGIMKESEAVKRFNLDGTQEANAIKFLANCSKRIFSVAEKGNIEKSWVISRNTEEVAKKVGQKAEDVLGQEKRVLTSEEIAKKISASFPEFEKEKVLSFLGVLSKVKKNKFGKWGMTNWAEISPKGTREKVYVILKETKKPLHFTEIAELIDTYKLGARKAHPQTVHNELIKDDRFVLIGRGIYALAEWGYCEGTIKEVLKDILAKSKTPLKREDILSEVLKLRKVKKSTVLINLNNEEIFERRNNLYSLRK